MTIMQNLGVLWWDKLARDCGSGVFLQRPLAQGDIACILECCVDEGLSDSTDESARFGAV